MKNRPSLCVTVSYEVPEGSWTAITVAPGMTPPCASLMTPVTEAVVTPCADAKPVGHISAHEMRSASIGPVRLARAPCDLFTCFIADSCGMENPRKDGILYSWGVTGLRQKRPLGCTPTAFDPISCS